MKDHSHFYDALTHVAWGYVLLHLNINLGTLNILPNWAGYLLLLSALPILGEEEPSAPLLQPLGQLLALWEGFVWVLALLGRPLSLPLAELVAGVVGLYFHFQLLTNLAELARRFPPPPEEPSYIPGTEPAQPPKPPAPLYRRLLRLRTARTLLLTLLFLPLPQALLEWEPFSWILILAHLVVALKLLFALFELRRAFPPPQEEPGAAL